MIALLQRVRAARVEVDEQVIGQIGRGLMVLVCAERNDTAADAQALADRLLRRRRWPPSVLMISLPRLRSGCAACRPAASVPICRSV